MRDDRTEIHHQPTGSIERAIQLRQTRRQYIQSGRAKDLTSSRPPRRLERLENHHREEIPHSGKSQATSRDEEDFEKKQADMNTTCRKEDM